MPFEAQFHVHNFRTGKGEVYFLHQIAGLTLQLQVSFQMSLLRSGLMGASPE
jgi:hypothetical protein